MKHIIKHGISLELAEKATRKALESYQERFAEYNPQVDWQSEQKAAVSFGVKGVTLDGDIEVDANDIAIGMKVPLLLRPFKKKAITVVEEEIQKWVARAKAGELD